MIIAQIFKLKIDFFSSFSALISLLSLLKYYLIRLGFKQIKTLLLMDGLNNNHFRVKDS